MRFGLLLACILASCGTRHVAEQQIVLINTDTLDRAGIAGELTAINDLSPKLVAIDYQFSTWMDPHTDSLLLHALKQTSNLFMVSIIDDYGDGAREHYDRFILGSLPEFLSTARTGFANTMFEENELRTLSRFATYAYVGDQIEYQLGVRVAMAYDSVLAMRYVKRHPRIVPVDYRNGGRQFKVFSVADVMGNKVSRKDIEGKIVLVGFLGPGLEDKFYTPCNINPDEPDMYGLEYLARIVAQIIESE